MASNVTAASSVNLFGLRVATDLSRAEQELLDYLQKSGTVDARMVQAVLAERRVTGEKLSFILTRSGFVSRQRLIDAILKTNPSGLLGEQHFSALIPPEVLIRTRTMVVAETNKQIMLASMDPERQVALELEPYINDMELVFVPLNHDQLEDYLSEVQRLSQDSNNFVERLIRRALSSNCSDVHITPRHNTYSVLFRYLGVRHLAHEGDMEEYNTLAARIKDMARMDLAERRVPQDGGFPIEHNGKMIDLRVATLPTANGESIVIRLLDPDRVQPKLDGLGISRIEEWRKGVSRPDGLCLICGPTGSGKTTTLNASVKELDRFGLAVNTVEDPVEYRIAYTNQVHINPAVGLDFSRAVRAFMRADPDVIILGEVRDAETARNAVKAAETGHLVIATLHTGSILGAIQRLRDLEVPAHELRHLIRSILVQRLIRVFCPECHGKGCGHCHGTGYTGRTVTSECAYFAGEAEVSKLLEGKRSWPTMVEDALRKVDSGETSEEEVMRVFGAEAEDAIAARRKSA